MSKIDSLLALYGMVANLYQYAGKDSNSRSDTESITGDKYTIIPKGCNEWDIDGIKVIALNKRSAIKKVKKLIG